MFCVRVHIPATRGRGHGAKLPHLPTKLADWLGPSDTRLIVTLSYSLCLFNSGNCLAIPGVEGVVLCHRWC